MLDQFEYNRLPGSGHFSFGFGRSSLWLADDHVLLLQRRGYVEDYKRFYFKDIHAFVIRKTATFFVVNTIFGLLLSACLLIHYLGKIFWDWEPVFHIILGVWTALFFIILAVNSLKGATCSTRLQTAVHSESVPSMSRIRSALSTMNILRRKIEEVQGRLTEEVLRQHPGIQLPPVLSLPPIEEITKNVLSNYKGGAHLALFSLLIIDAIQTVFAIFNRSKVLFVLSVIMNGILWALVVIALVKQRRADLPRTVTGLTWGTLIYGSTFYAFSYFFYMILVMQDPAGGPSQFEWIKKLWEISPLEHPGLLFLMVFSIICSITLGIPGLISLLRARSRGQSLQQQTIVGGDAA